MNAAGLWRMVNALLCREEHRGVGCCRVTILCRSYYICLRKYDLVPKSFRYFATLLLQTLDISEGLPDAANMPHSASDARWIVSLQVP
jgi:hypothetical protein